jgi:hypothetical protein
LADIDVVLAANRAALDDLVVAAERSAATWAVPRAPGKWSPSQVVEHVARAFDESANMVSGAPSKFPRLPGFVRPVLRGLFFNRVLRTGVFPKVKTSKALDPASGPASPAEARIRLEGALGRFDRECRLQAVRGPNVESTAFGVVSLEDYARFQEIHVRHHCSQLPGAGETAPGDPGMTRRGTRRG